METCLRARAAKVTPLAERVERRRSGRSNRPSLLESAMRVGVMTSTAAALALAVTLVWPGDAWMGLRSDPAGILPLVILRAVLALEAPAVVFRLALLALSLGLMLSRTAALGRPVEALEVKP